MAALKALVIGMGVLIVVGLGVVAVTIANRLTADEAGIVDDIMASDASLVFGPDTLAEARNRGYRDYKRYAE